jgi:catechol 2,3-dioxygenase-like lactoylglutathione lyase family enzyme
MAAIGIELVVEDLDRAIELFVSVLGCRLISRGPAPLVAGEVAAIDAGNIVISLLLPARSGTNALMSHREPRLAQLIFGASGATGVSAAFDRALNAGLSLTDMPDGRFAILPEVTRGALGLEVAIVAVPMESE